MKPWPKKHRILAKAMLLMALAFVAAIVFMLRPVASEVRSLREEADVKEAAIREKGWPLDAGRLANLEKSRLEELDQTRKLSDRVFKLSTSMFDEQLKFYGGSPVEFRNGVTRIDFESEYTKIRQKFENLGILLYEDYLGLGTNSDSPYTDQLVLQTWTLEKALDAALASGLTPVRTPEDQQTVFETEDGGFLVASQVRVRPVRAYFLTDEDKDKQAEPYLLELPVSMNLEGSVPQLATFLSSVTSSEPPLFLPVSHLEVRKVVPSAPDSPDDRITVTVECSAFFSMTKGAGSGPTPTGGKPVLPSGA